MKTKTPAIDFSIIIPTLNEEKYLPHLLNDLAEQSFPKDRFEVIVVDGNSTDGTIKEALKLSSALQLVTISAKTANVSTQRNLGVKKATAKWVIFMDADNRIPPAFLDGIKYQLATKQHTDCFTCWVEESGYKTADKPLITMLNLLTEVLAMFKPGAMGALIGAKHTLASKYPFNHKLAISEDYEFIGKLVRSGHRFTVFRFPRYHYSLRRFEREGVLKLARVYTKAQLYVLMGRQIKNGEIDYQMGGDAHVPKSAWHQTNLKQLQSNITDLLKNHKKTAQKILNWLNQDQI